MKAAVVRAAAQPPVYGDVPDPTPGPGEVRIRVSAAALSNLVRSRASGTHYSSDGQFPFVVGVDGVGRLDDGRRVYFVLPRTPNGSFSEMTVIRGAQVIPVPDELGDVAAAALVNPGMASWTALIERAQLRSGESVLINGGTGTAGHLAVQVAKHLGARRVVATGRNLDALAIAAQLGADTTIPLGTDPDAFEAAVAAQFRDGGFDVVLDYLWGWPAERILAAGAKTSKDASPLRFVQVASLNAPSLTLPSAALRSSATTLMGSGIGSIPTDRLLASFDALLKAAVPAGFKVETSTLPLSEIEKVWATAPTMPRLVFQIG
jgi:NADPH:quinone reductase-like Zn-dependent oxidoreductase